MSKYKDIETGTQNTQIEGRSEKFIQDNDQKAFKGPAFIGEARGLPANIHIIRMKELSKILGQSRSSIYDKIKKKNFPAPLRLGLRGRGWLSTTIQEYLLSL